MKKAKMWNVKDLRSYALVVVMVIGGLGMVGCAETDDLNPRDDDPAQIEIVGAEQLDWVLEVGQSGQAQFEIENPGDEYLEFEFHYDASWLDLSPTSAAVGPGDAVQIDAQASCPAEPGQFETTVDVESNADSSPELQLTARLQCEAEAIGSLQITIEGLPDDQQADVAIEGPDDFEAGVTQSEQFDEVVVGTYTVSALPVGDAARYDPNPEQISVEVNAGERADVTIDYALVLGSVQIDVDGLPGAVEPDLTLVRDGDQWDVPADGFIDDLVPGTYTVISEEIEDDQTIYRASDVDAAVRSDETAQVTVVFLVDSGALEVDVGGLPDGVEHDIDVIDADGQVTSLPQSGELAALEEGDYELVPNDVTDGPAIFEAASTVATVISDQTASATISYEVITGGLDVAATGLPTGVDPAIEIDGPDGTQTHDQDVSLTGLTPGDYTITYADVDDGSLIYRVSDSPTDMVVESAQTTQVQRDYELVPGDLVVDVTEVGDVTFQVTIDGPDGFSQSVDGPASFDDVAAGEYSVTIDTLPSDSSGNQGYVDISPGATFDIGSEQSQTLVLTVGEATLVSTSTGSGPGSLRYAIESNLAPGSTITFDSGVDEVVVSGGDIEIDYELDIEGDDDALTSIAGDGDRIFTITAGGFLSLQGLTLKDGDSSAHGGAIYLHDGGALIAEKTIFEDNTAQDRGGAIYVQDGAALHLIETIFRNNHASSDGGALYASLGSDLIIDVEASLFEANSSNGDGGALRTGGEFSIYESTFVDNSAAGDGGAIYVWDGDTTVIGSTIVDNSAAGGGGIQHFGDLDTQLILGRSVVAENTAGTDDDIGRSTTSTDVNSLGYNVVGVAAAGIVDGQNGDQAGSETSPLSHELGAFTNNGGFSQTRRPLASSPARSSVPADVCEEIGNMALPVRDQRRQRRPSGATCNVGAMELDATHEGFENADMSAGSYEDGSFTGVDGIVWHYEQVRRNTGDYVIEDTSLILHGDNDSKIYAQDIPDGISSISFQLSKAFTGSGDRQVEVLVDGAVVGTTTPFDDDTQPYPVYRFGFDDIGVSGTFDLEIRALSDRQVVLDNLTWR